MDRKKTLRLFSNAAQGKNPGSKAMRRIAPPTGVSPDSEYIQKLNELSDELEDYNGDYAYAHRYTVESCEGVIEDEAADFEESEDNTSLTEEEIREAAQKYFKSNEPAFIMQGYENDDFEEDTIIPEHMDLEIYRQEFFHYMQRSAALLNLVPDDICAAMDCDFNALWDRYLDSDPTVDDDMIRITQSVYFEIDAFKEALILGRRQTNTKISDYMAKLPLRKYTQNLGGEYPEPEA